MRIKKFLSVFVLTFFVKFGFGQVYQSMPQYGYGPVKRFDVDSTLTIPTVCGVPTLKSNILRKSAIAFDTCNNRFYFYNSKTLVWDTIKGGAGNSIDTTSLSNRINLKLNISDTTNKWVNSVTKVNDSTIRVVKGTTTTDIVINPQATKLVTEVYNKTGSPISKGAVVYIDGKHSNNLPSIALAEANNEANSYKTFALVADNIPNMSSGYVIQAGTITGLNLPTNTYTDGDILYLSPTIPGGYTTTKPLAPNHIVKLGSVVNAHPTQGRIEIKIENGWQLDELSDVQIAAVPADSVLLQFSRVDSLWHDVSPITAIGNRYIKPTDTASMLSTYQRSISAVKYSDTANLVLPYLRKIDTASLSNRINLKLNISDSANMLSKYLRKTDTSTLSSRIDLRVRYSDTASMLSTYQRSISAMKYTDTASMLSPYLRSNVAAATYQKQIDTIPLFVFGAGSGAAGDTSIFSTSALYGSFYNDYSDTIIVTAIRIGLRGTSANINATVYFNDSLGTTAGATQIISGGTTASNIHTGTVATSITNNKIAPGNWVWVQTGTITTKPTFFILTIFGYRKPV